MYNITQTTAFGTTSSQLEDTFYAALLACRIINVIVLGLTVYLSACVLIYGYKTGSWRTANTSELNKGGIYTLCVIAIFSDIPRFIMTEIVYSVNSIPGAAKHCEALIDSSNVAHYLSSLSKYLFLWYRQHTINSCPTINRIAFGKWAKVVSYTIAVIIFIVSLLMTYFYISPHSTDHAPVLGCVFISIGNGTDRTEEISRLSKDYILAAGLVLNEIVLLILFIYPLYQIRQSNRRLRGSSSSAEVATTKKLASRKGSHPPKASDSLTNLIKRSTIAAAISVAADLLLIIIVSITPYEWPVAILMLIYNVKNTVHAVCIIFTFSFYKQILCIFWIVVKKTQLATSRSDVVEASEQSKGISRQERRGNASDSLNKLSTGV